MADSDTEVETEVFFKSPPLRNCRTLTDSCEDDRATMGDDDYQAPEGEADISCEWQTIDNGVRESEQRCTGVGVQDRSHESTQNQTEKCMKEAVDKMVNMQTQMAGVLQGVAQVLQSMNRRDRQQSEVTETEMMNNNTNSSRPRVDRTQNYRVTDQNTYSDDYSHNDYNRHSSAHTPRNYMSHPDHNRLEQAPRYREHYAARYQNRMPEHAYTQDDHDNYPHTNHNAFSPRRGQGYMQIKIPAFQGKENWQVWISRFEALAERQGWSDDEKLDQLLPHLQGVAAEFVFTQLRRETLHNYKELITEIGYRFRVVETSKTFAAKFSRRDQRGGETAEEYAAELKCLYDKAHPSRDSRTRKEDLVRRFLDGLRDDDIRCEIEFVKEPTDIDEAVYHAVNLIHTRRPVSAPYGDKKMRKMVRSTSHTIEEEDYEDSIDADRVCRVPTKMKPHQEKETPEKPTQPTPSSNKETTEVDTNSILLQLLNKITEFIDQKQEKAEQANRSVKSMRGRCFTCSQMGHFARDCPLKPDDQNRLKRNQAPSQKNVGHLNMNGPSLMAERRSKMM